MDVVCACINIAIYIQWLIWHKQISSRFQDLAQVLVVLCRFQGPEHVYQYIYIIIGWQR